MVERWEDFNVQHSITIRKLLTCVSHSIDPNFFRNIMCKLAFLFIVFSFLTIIFRECMFDNVNLCENEFVCLIMCRTGLPCQVEDLTWEASVKILNS